jgi:hypothetical protein
MECRLNRIETEREHLLRELEQQKANDNNIHHQVDRSMLKSALVDNKIKSDKNK